MEKQGKKIFFIIIGVAIVVIGILQFFVLNSSKPKDQTIDEFTYREFDDYNAYRIGKDSLSLSIAQESEVVCCSRHGLKVSCSEVNARTLLTESDVNHDSLVTYDELRQSVQKSDSNKDGFINKNERNAYLQRYNIEIKNSRMFGSEETLPYRLDYNPLKLRKQ